MASIGVTASALVLMVFSDYGHSAAWVKRQNRAIQITHCCIHKEGRIIKLLSQEFSETMKNCIKIVNLIKAKV